MRNLRSYYSAPIADFLRQSDREILGIIHANDISAETTIQHSKLYLKNAYRVLLTRARQGMVIFIPEGSDTDQTRKREWYDKTYEYLKSVEINELE